MSAENDTPPVKGESLQRPVRSMTGYARVSSREGNGSAWTLTLKSINHRFLDLQFRLPASAERLETEIRAKLKAELVRGHVDCTLATDRGAPRDGTERRMVAAEFDRAALRAYIEDFRRVAMEFGVASEPDLNLAARLPGMLTTGVVIDGEQETEAQVAGKVSAMLAEALVALQDMRAVEGAALTAILQQALDRLAALVQEVAGLRGDAQAAQYAKLSERLAELVGDSFDRDRVLTEAALVAERSDVEEEAARLHTHIAHFHALLDGGGEVGKKLDFLLQEMNREANTLLSKTAGTTGGSLRITECGLAMKAEIEKLREQVQNLE